MLHHRFGTVLDAGRGGTRGPVHVIVGWSDTGAQLLQATIHLVRALPHEMLYVYAEGSPTTPAECPDGHFQWLVDC